MAEIFIFKVGMVDATKIVTGFSFLMLIETKPLWGGKAMLGYIYRLIRRFEQEHGVPPNLLYLNRVHAEHLQSSFDEKLTLVQVMDILQMEMIVDPEFIHPSVVWRHAAEQIAS